MIWAKVALAGGLFLLFAAFAFGVENRQSTSVMDQSYDCGAAISASWLVPGTPDQMNPGPGATTDERLASAECGAVIRPSRVLVMTTMGFGGLLALVGWARLRENAGSRLPDRGRGAAAQLHGG